MESKIAQKGKQIFKKLEPQLKKRYELGDYVSIEVESGKFFVGKNSIEALDKAQKAFPQKQFFLAQVGRIAGLLKWIRI